MIGEAIILESAKQLQLGWYKLYSGVLGEDPTSTAF